MEQEKPVGVFRVWGADGRVVGDAPAFWSEDGYRVDVTAEMTANAEAGETLTGVLLIKSPEPKQETWLDRPALF